MRRFLLFPLAPAALLAAPAAAQQVNFSIDWHGPTNGLADPCTNTKIDHGDILRPAAGVPTLGPLAPPCIAVPSGAGGLNLPGGNNCAAGNVCKIEVDALSHGNDSPLLNAAFPKGRLWFSVDEYARGNGLAVSLAPSVGSEAPHGDSSCDVFISFDEIPVGPLHPPAVPKNNLGTIDGNGLVSGSGHTYPGVGLIEPNKPINVAPPDEGDNLDAFDLDDPIANQGRVYFSLDAAFVDPINGVPNLGSAAAAGGSGGDVFMKDNLAAAVAVWAQAQQLGLDLNAFGVDDLDALVLVENGTGVYEPSKQPYDWQNGSTDMLLFSVRRGSAVIGQPDSIFGIPIEEGDILTTPLHPNLGGLSPYPGMFIAAEWLGLDTKRQSPNQAHGDDLNAADIVATAFFDCNGNNVEDSVDIAVGTSDDLNMNGIPDECETFVVSFCQCSAGAPCGNEDPNAGCRNSTGVGAALASTGSTSVTSDDLILKTSGVPTNQFGLTFMGGDFFVIPVPMGDGLRCLGGTLYRFPVRHSGNAGVLVEGPGMVAYSQANFPVSGQIVAGSTWGFQTWYRDPGGPCGTTSNVSDALAITFLP